MGPWSWAEVSIESRPGAKSDPPGEFDGVFEVEWISPAFQTQAPRYAGGAVGHLSGARLLGVLLGIASVAAVCPFPSSTWCSRFPGEPRYDLGLKYHTCDRVDLS